MTAYEQGFLTKCAEYGVDERVLLKTAGPSLRDKASANVPGAKERLAAQKRQAAEQAARERENPWLINTSSRAAENRQAQLLRRRALSRMTPEQRNQFLQDERNLIGNSLRTRFGLASAATVGAPGAAGILAPAVLGGTGEGLASGAEGRGVVESTARGVGAGLLDLAGAGIVKTPFLRRAFLHPVRTINAGVARGIATMFPSLAKYVPVASKYATRAGTASAVARMADLAFGPTQENYNDSPLTVGGKRLARKAIQWAQLLNPGLAVTYAALNEAGRVGLSPWVYDKARNLVDKDVVENGIRYVNGIDPDAATALTTTAAVSGLFPFADHVARSVGETDGGVGRSVGAFNDLYNIARRYYPDTFPEINTQFGYDQLNKAVARGRMHAAKYLSGVDDPNLRRVGNFALDNPEYAEGLLSRLVNRDYATPVLGRSPFFLDAAISGLKRGIGDTAVEFAREKAETTLPPAIGKAKDVVVPLMSAWGVAQKANDIKQKLHIGGEKQVE